MDALTDSLRWHELSWLIGLVSMTGRIEPFRKPQSLLIYGNPGSGKTANLERFMAADGETMNPHLVFVTNATTMGLQTILQERVPRGATHMIVPEFQTLLLKRGGVWETMLGTLLPAMEEGVRDVYVGPKRLAFGGARLGLVAAMPTDAYFQHAAMLQATGFLSRMLRVRYDRSSDHVLAARHRVNDGDRSELCKIDAELPASIRVTVPATMRAIITEYAASVDSGNIHREANRFEALAQAVAFTCRERTVTIKHIAMLVGLEHFWKQ